MQSLYCRNAKLFLPRFHGGGDPPKQIQRDDGSIEKERQGNHHKDCRLMILRPIAEVHQPPIKPVAQNTSPTTLCIFATRSVSTRKVTSGLNCRSSI